MCVCLITVTNICLLLYLHIAVFSSLKSISLHKQIHYNKRVNTSVCFVSQKSFANQIIHKLLHNTHEAVTDISKDIITLLHMFIHTLTECVLLCHIPLARARAHTHIHTHTYTYTHKRTDSHTLAYTSAHTICRSLRSKFILVSREQVVSFTR